jgi:hypothetical protein
MLILQGLRQLCHFDERGFLFFDASRKGFWRSFAAALWCLPIWSLAQYEQMANLDAAKVPHFLMVQGVAYVIAWLAYPLLMVRLSDVFGVWPNYYRYMVGYNWFRAVLQLIWLPLLLLNLFPDAQAPGMITLFFLVVQGVELSYDWFLARHGLGVQPGTAFALAFIDFLLGVLIDQTAAML